MDALAKGWFSEVNEVLWKGQCFSLRVNKVLFDEKSDYQHVQVFESETFGRVLVLDGVIQLTERDECAYQEMLAHLPLVAHGKAKRVCVIGGGDGGVVREITRHADVEAIILCDIDKMVPEVSKKFFPNVSKGFADPRVTVHIGDGAAFVAEHKDEFDVIITDSSDPVGPAEVLFEKPYYEGLHASLKEGGVIATQGECMWNHLPLIKNMLDFSRTIFDVAEYAITSVPSYPSGSIGFIISSKKGKDIPAPDPKVPAKEFDHPELMYYSTEIHKASYVLPTFVRKALAEAAPPLAGGAGAAEAAAATAKEQEKAAGPTGGASA